MHGDLSDTVLMQHVAAGHQGAFRTLVLRHLARAHGIARRVLASSEDSEEVVQDAFCKVWAHAAGFDPERAAFTTWLYRIVTNLCLDRTRRKTPPHAAIEDVRHFVPTGDQGQDTSWSINQENERIRNALHKLPDRQRMAVVLCYFEELTNPEAARAMGIHQKALEGLLVRARKSLRQLLG
ncbi:MAG: hypothetical protein BWK76_04805 [Desulfobulbaceae bacterium A2]|nr:MAG: hypothetical protein BWK76_04805 [Desulfobulbaceae bacterium A2]